jgi:hypothetical protein
MDIPAFVATMPRRDLSSFLGYIGRVVVGVLLRK